MIVIEAFKNALVDIIPIYICIGNNARDYAKQNVLEHTIDETMNWPPRPGSTKRLASLIRAKIDEDRVPIVFYDRISGRSIIYPFLLSRICLAPLVCYQHGENEGSDYGFSYVTGWYKKTNFSPMRKAYSIVKANVELIYYFGSISIESCKVWKFEVLNRLRHQLFFPSYGAFADFVFISNNNNKPLGSVFPAYYHVVGSLVKERALLYPSFPFAATRSPTTLRSKAGARAALLYTNGVFRSGSLEAINLGRKFIKCICDATRELGLDLAIKCKTAEQDELLGIRTHIDADYKFSDKLSGLIISHALIILPVDSVSCIEASILGINYVTYNIWDAKGMIGEANSDSNVPSIYDNQSSADHVRAKILSLLENQSKTRYPGGRISIESMNKIVGKSWPKTSSKIVDVILSSQLS